jgi:hypothetical protein
MMQMAAAQPRKPAWAAEKNRRDAERHLQARQAARDLVLPAVKDPARRAACLADPYEFLRVYVGTRFRKPFTSNRRRIVDEILYRVRHGGMKALAAPRGDGKTSIAEAVVGVYAPLAGLLRYAVIAGATGAAATNILSNIKSIYELSTPLAEDFPEVCFPILALEGSPLRAAMQTVGGNRTRLKWQGDQIVLPTVEGSVASGVVIAAKSLDGAIRGLRVDGQRPDLVIIDDPETRESATSETECERRERIIEGDLGGLGSGGQPASMLMLTTCMNCSSLSFRFTDPKQKAAWAGERMALLQEWPTNAELWDRYVTMRKDDHENGDVEARKAHQFYLDNREAMDAGAVVSDPDRFDARETPDGTPREVSALQAFYNAICDKSLDYVLTELQNAPPIDVEAESDQLTPGKVKGTASGYSGRLSGLPEGIVPPGTRYLTAFVDVGDSMLTWEVCGWQENGRCLVVEYGKTATDSRIHVGIEVAIPRALKDVAEHFQARGYQLSAALVDSGSGDHQPLVYQFIRERGFPWFPSKGEGRYAPPKDSKDGRIALPFMHLTPVATVAPQRLVVMHSSHWKKAAHESFRLPPIDKDGSQAERTVRLWGLDPHRHTEFATEITNEVFKREFIVGRGWREEWVVLNRANHYLDTHYGCMAAHGLAQFLEAERNRPQRRYGVLSKGVQ